MKINKKLFYGTWILRSTNNNKLNNDNTLTYLSIKDETAIKLKTFANYNYVMGLKKSKIAIIDNINESENSLLLDFSWITKNTYTYSILGIEIPEIKTNSIEYLKETNISVELHNTNILIATDMSNFDNDLNSHYYIFDLYKGKMKYPNIETSLNTFMFSQIFAILFSILFNNIFLH
jgi:hypothetical protein